MPDFNAPLFVKTVLQSYAAAATEATRGLWRNWIIIPASVVAYFILQIFVQALSPFPPFYAGFILGLIQVILLSFYYSWIAETANKQTLRWRELYQLDYGLFSAIINVGFIIFLATLVLRTMLTNLDADWILLCFSLGVTILFNPVPEVIHTHRSDGMQSLKHACEFVQANWIEWFLPLVIFMSPWIAINPAHTLLTMSDIDPLLPAFILLRETTVLAIYWGGMGALVPAIIIGIILANWFMLFRAHLFNELDGGTRRRRMFQAKNR